MRNIFLPFSRPSIGNEEIDGVHEVLTGGWITTGPKNTQFEINFSQYCGSRGGVALASATAGMHLLLTALGIGPGDEVITPSMTWVSTVNLIIRTGATPVFADVDRDTLMTGIEFIKPLISEKTRLIIPVHFAGAAVDMLPLRSLAAEHDIPLIEDAAHAVGTEYMGERIGCRGTAIFSFHPNKNMTTGEGGMICSESEELLQSINRLKFHGLGSDNGTNRQQGRSARAEVWEPGFKYNMTDIAATIGLGQLTRLDSFIAKRSLLARRYQELLQEVEEVKPLEQPPGTNRHAWHLFAVRLDTDLAGMSRDQFMEELSQRNIGTGLHFRAVHQHRYYRQEMPMIYGTLPNTEWNSDRVCSLPLFPLMTMEDVDDVVTAIKEVLRP